MITPDSSVAIAALAPWHVGARAAQDALRDQDVRLVAHVAFEITSALSRMPEGRRLAATLVVQAVARRFPAPWIALDGKHMRDALEHAVAAGVRGGALYDALIAATAMHHDMTIVSADHRARRTYTALGASVSYVSF